MVNKQLLDYIVSVREKGYQDEAIKAHLIKYGYASAEVEQAFSQIDSTKKRSGKHNIILFVLIGVLVLGILAGGYLFITGSLYSSSQVCEGVSIDLYKTNEQPVICSIDESRLQMIIENKGERQVDFVEILVNTDNGRHKETLDNLFFPGEDLITKVIDIDNPGVVREVKITPGIIEDNKRYTCNSNQKSFTDIKNC